MKEYKNDKYNNDWHECFHVDDDVYYKKITTRVSQNQILHGNADQPKA
jgi:hypothetical protein